MSCAASSRDRRRAGSLLRGRGGLNRLAAPLRFPRGLQRDDESGPATDHPFEANGSGDATAECSTTDTPGAAADGTAMGPYPAPFGDLRAARGDRPGRHGRRLQGPAGQPEPAGRPQDDPRRPARRATTTSSGSATRPRRSPTSTIRTSCRSTRSASTRASTTSA